MTGHELTILTGVRIRPIATGTCSCGRFRFRGPEQMIRDMHAAHLVHPGTKFTGEGA